MKEGLTMDCPSCSHELKLCCVVEEGQTMYLVRYKCPASEQECPLDCVQVWQPKRSIPSGTPVYWKLLAMQRAGAEMKRDEEIWRKSHKGLHAQ